MNKKLLKVALIGKTNAGKSTLINAIVGEQISIINKKINTTQESIIGIKNISDNQIVFYDTPGSNFLKSTNILQKKLKINIWQSIDSVDLILYIIDTAKYDFKRIEKDILKISEVKKSIIFIFNKIDLIDRKNILYFISELKKLDLIEDFFLLSAKFNRGIDLLLDHLISKSINNKWVYENDELTDKDDIFITNECTRNAILEYLHQEIPYNIKVTNNLYKFLHNNDLKIQQIIELTNVRYKPIILGKNGMTIKKIRERSQKDIQNILNCKVHLYLKVSIINEK